VNEEALAHWGLSRQNKQKATVIPALCLTKLGRHNLKKTPDALECMNVVLLHSKHRHVSAAHVAFFRVVRTRMQIKLVYQNQSTV
jgi:hypothetical protein